MRTTDLISTKRSGHLHIKASPVQPHEWYHEMFAGTLCGRWMHVEVIHNDVSLDELGDLDDAVCPTCIRKSRRFTR